MFEIRSKTLKKCLREDRKTYPLVLDKTGNLALHLPLLGFNQFELLRVPREGSGHHSQVALDALGRLHELRLVTVDFELAVARFEGRLGLFHVIQREGQRGRKELARGKNDSHSQLATP